MALIIESLAPILEKSFVRVERTAFAEAEIFSAAGTPEFACDDYKQLMIDLEMADPEAYRTVCQWIARRTRGLKPWPNPPEMHSRAIREVMIVLGGIHEAPYRYEPEGYWKKKTNIGW